MTKSKRKKHFQILNSLLFLLILSFLCSSCGSASQTKLEKRKSENDLPSITLLSYEDVLEGKKEKAPAHIVFAEEISSLEKGFKPSGKILYAKEDLCPIKKEAESDAPKIGELKRGESIYEESRNGTWSKLKLPSGDTGFALSLFFSEKEEDTKEDLKPKKQGMPQDKDFYSVDKILYSAFSGLFTKKEPSPRGEAVTQLYYGSPIHVIAEEPGGWLKAEDIDGEIRYIHSDFLMDEEPILTGEIEHRDVDEIYTVENNSFIPSPSETFNPVVGSGSGNDVANTALGFLGYPYVWGAAGPSAFDCSGFTSYIYSLYGIGIGRTTYAQTGAGVGVPFSYGDYSALAPGDILLFAEGGNVFHAGMYIGGGQMVHAGNASTGVIVDNLSLPYYANRLAYVRRIF